MGKNRLFFGMLAITAFYGLVFSLVLNVFFDLLINSVWTPLAISFIFFIFSIPLSIIIVVVSKKKKTHSVVPFLFRKVVIIVLLLSVLSCVFEVLYEIDSKISTREADSYVFLVDDSGSMTSSDPNNLRVSSAEKLLSDKDYSIPYAVYTFSNSIEQKKTMSVSSNGLRNITLKSDGGTPIYGVLNQVIRDIESNKLDVHESTRVILLSDGAATDMGIFDAKLKPLLSEYGNRGLIISTIGLGNGVNSSLMKKIAKYTGGVYIHISDISELDDAMIDAAVNLSDRNLLGFRGYCKTNALHAVMRIVFVLVILVIVSIMKFYSYGKYYKKLLILSCVTTVVASVMLEVFLENLNINESVVRIMFFVLVSLTVIEKSVFLTNKSSHHSSDSEDDYENGTSIKIGDSSTINDDNEDDFFSETKYLT